MEFCPKTILCNHISATTQCCVAYSSQHPAAPFAPQPQRLASAQPPEQLRIRHRPTVAAGAPELRLVVFLRVGCRAFSRRTPRHPSGELCDRIVGRLFVGRHRAHRCLLSRKSLRPRRLRCGMSCWTGISAGTLRPVSSKACCPPHWQTHHVRRAFPFAGGPGLACRSCARVSFLAAGRRRRTWSLRARALILISASCFAVPVPSGLFPDYASS